MRKRLIERITKSKQGSLGYTLTELLVVIGIIAVICAIAIPSVFAIRNALRFAKLNNYAKTIFLAAQQNLTEMRSDGGLGPVQSAAAHPIPGEVTTFPTEFRTEYVYTFTGEEAFDRVLPAMSVDADIRDDQIVIEYNPLTGNVYSVYYYDKTDKDLVADYAAGSLPREKEKLRKVMVGYYDGSGLNSSQIELEKTQATVEFINGEEGIVQVRIPMPESYFGDYNKFATALSISLTITGEQSATNVNQGVTPELLVIQIKNSGELGNCRLDVDGKTIIQEFPIDSLAARLSFVNYITGTEKKPAGQANANEKSLTTLLNESEFLKYNIFPGENITIQADVTFDGDGTEIVKIDPGILSGVNPMFEYLQPSGTGRGYVLAVANGRNLQNLNAISPTIAKQIVSVVFTNDIYWNDTVNYYNEHYGDEMSRTVNSTLKLSDSNSVNVAVYDEAPARALPYFVPIHNENLFGTARFIFPGQNDAGVSEDGGLADYIWDQIKDFAEGTIKDFGGFLNNEIPTLTDELDLVGKSHATIQGNGHRVLNLRIDSTKYQIPNAGKTETRVDENGESHTIDYTGTFYGIGDYQIIDYTFTGLFGYVNTPIHDLHVVNPIIKGYPMTYSSESVPTYITINLPLIGPIKLPGDPKIIQLYNNPATGALVGASGYNTLITNCSAYIDKDVRGYMAMNWGPYAYDTTGYQNWYGVTGEGAVGGLVGYAKSHLNITGEINGEEVALAFSNCFAAVPVSGNMRGHAGKQFGYSNGVGAFIGNSQLTNFYNCYASGDVLANNCAVYSIDKIQGSLRDLTEVFGVTLDLLYTGRTSAGAGGFVGTSHGTRYTNCFSTGDVRATVSGQSQHALGGGGFVGFMSIDETFNYGHADNNNDNIAQRTIFTNCYSVGKAVTGTKTFENFSGANGRIALTLNQSVTYLVGDYFRLYAPYYHRENKSEPVYGEAYYIYRDSYFLSGYHEGGQDNSGSCASPDTYSAFENLVANHTIGKDAAGNRVIPTWMAGAIQNIKDIVIREKSIFNWTEDTYQSEYFNPHPELTGKYQDLYAAGFPAKYWGSATATSTHPYSLPDGQRYPFTKLAGLDYYGDWPSKPSDVGLAYYETYKDTGKTHYIFDRSHNDNAALSLREGSDALVIKDGYAIFSANNADLTVTVTNGADTVTETLKVTSEIYTVSNKTYHVFRLTDTLMSVLPTGDEFYVQLTAKHAGVNDTYTMYFNPSVSTAHVNPVEGGKTAVKPDGAPTSIYIRSARQFAYISSLDNFWNEGTRYIQQLNIDATQYQWPQGMTAAVGSIGDLDNPFNASYSANYVDTVTGLDSRYTLAGFQLKDAAGLFGVIGEKGSVSDLIVEFDNVTSGSTQTVEYAAALAGTNHGTLDNVAVTLNRNIIISAKSGAGVLAGITTGTITDCDVTVSQAATLDITAPNVGGAIGVAQGAEEKPAAFTGNVTVNCAFNAVASDTTGGLVGKATYFSAENFTIVLKSVSSSSKNVGGVAGYAENATFTGRTGVIETVISGTMTSSSANSYVAGVVGEGKDTTITGVDVQATGTISGNIAAGFLGTGVNVDATNCDVMIGSVSGTAGAAGGAGTIDSQSVFSRVSVNLNGGANIISSQGNAAGFALEILGEAIVNSSSVTLSEYVSNTDDFGVVTLTPRYTTTIQASGEAAGYACVISGTVGDSHVAGCGKISGADAAGFAVTVNGSVGTAYVSPALTADAAGYDGNNNANLQVSGSNSAAGFALTLNKNGTISNSYALCKISSAGTIEVEIEAEEEETTAPTETTAPVETTAPSVPTESSEPTETTEAPVPTESVTSAFAFVGTNKGTINRSTANVDITGGFDFVGVNEGLISTCYGWYNDTATQNPAHAITGKGKCFNSYFADMTPAGSKVICATVYDAQGVATLVTPSELQATAITGFNTGYEAYPYQEMIPEDYLYPMLRNHYGNWLTPPQYAYGIAYYEIYSDMDTRMYLVELSDSTITEETLASVTINRKDSFDNSGTILETGYAMFYNSEITGITGEKLDLTYSLGDAFSYDFYAYEPETDGIYTIEKTTSRSKSAQVNTCFANAIKFDGTFAETGETYIVRTPEQLANIGSFTANFNQTHDITASGLTGAAIAQGHTYNGGNFALIANSPANTWITSLGGTVQNLNLTVLGDLNVSLFGDVSGTISNVNLKVYGGVENPDASTITAPVVATVNQDASVSFGTVDLKTIGAGGALAGTVTGNVTTGSIQATVLNGSLITTMQGGTVTTGNITVSGLNAPLVGTFTSGTLQGAESAKAQISVPSIGTTLFTNVLDQNGTIKNYTIGQCSVTLNGKNAKGALVNENKGMLNGLTLRAGTITVKPEETAAIGGLTSINLGNITDCVLEGAAAGTPAQVTITGKVNTGITFGGLVAVNGGDIVGSATKADADITYIQPALGAEDQADWINIGGLVGDMNGGKLNNAKAEGQILLTDQANLDYLELLAKLSEGEEIPEPPAAPSASGRRYIIGGAVAVANNGSYSKSSADVALDVKWAGGLFAGDVSLMDISAISPSGMGPVGKFVGYIGSGSFDQCAGNDAVSKFQFVGQLNATRATLDAHTAGSDDWFSAAATNGPATQDASGTDSTTQMPVYETYTREVDGYAYYNFDGITLTGCTFRYPGSDTSYAQNITTTKYFYNGTEYHVQGYTASRFGSLSATVSTPSIKQLHPEFRSISAFNKYYATEFYWCDTNGIYHKVYVKSTLGTGEYTLYIAYKNGNSYVDINSQKVPMKFSGTGDEAFNKETLYKNVTGTAFDATAGLYMIADSSGSNVMVLNADGTISTLSFTGSFNTKNPIAKGVWEISGQTWKNVLSPAQYLHLSGSTTVGGSKNLTVSNISYTGESHSLAMYTILGDTYLNFASGNFGCGDASGLILYSVATNGTPYWNGDFTYAQKFDQRCTASPALPESSSMSYSDLPGETGEAPEATDPTVPTEVATVPPAKENGDNT